jgi:acyl dehydratase
VGPGRIPVRSVSEIEALRDRDLGPSGWVRADQRAIDAFADATGDHQWIRNERDAITGKT